VEQTGLTGIAGVKYKGSIEGKQNQLNLTKFNK
jgi:hypothetical protein